LALCQLAALDRSVRDELAIDAETRWGEALPGLTSDVGREFVGRVLSGCPDAQVLHLVAEDEDATSGDTRLAAAVTAAGPRRYLRVDPTHPDAGDRVTRFVRPAGEHVAENP
jgi:hypothetical protein